MDWKLEVVTVPVSDVDRAKAFYADRLGFVVDHDTTVGEMRVVQLTPRGSACSIVLSSGVGDATPGSAQGLQLVVPDIHGARSELVERGVNVSEVQEFDSAEGTYRPLAHEADWNAFVFFRDPDGNGWVVQHRGG
jgi:catechol 2,3-dioxygenase-like lactoylglutathione lyase family enzyme